MRGEQDITEALVQNLKDAGCGKSIIDEFLDLFEKKDREKILKLLEKYRVTLLKNLHKNQREIDNLYYLIVDLKNNDYMGGENNEK